jgi:hypothetical protein
VHHYEFHKLAPFVRQKPEPMSEIEIYRQLRRLLAAGLLLVGRPLAPQSWPEATRPKLS